MGVVKDSKEECLKYTQVVSASYTAHQNCFDPKSTRFAAEQTQYTLCRAGVSDKSALCECAKTAYQSKICANETCKSGLEYTNEGISIGEKNAYGYSIESQ